MAVPLRSSLTTSTSLKGMVFLESKNSILLEELKSLLLEGRREPCEVKFGDFDDFSYKLVVDPQTLNIVTLNVSFNAADAFINNGSFDLLNQLFPGLLIEPESGYQIALSFNCDQYMNNMDFIHDLSHIRRHILAGPLVQSIDNMIKGNQSVSNVYAYRANENIYICPSSSKVTIIFSVDFQDMMDKAMAKIFLQEFAECQRTVRTAPPVSYSRDPPMEISSFSPFRNDIAGYLSFGVEPRHVEGSKKDNVINLLTGFHSYLYYHIKSTKTYLQMRMRKRLGGWLQVLNRAVPEVETEKKTAAGKTFTRK